MAQLTTTQRERDFEELAIGLARFYAPANWKMQALRENIFDLTKWMPRVRAARSDREYFQVKAEYIASLKDGHLQTAAPSFFVADAEIAVDLYDGRVLLEVWNPAAYSTEEYDWAVGDELVSLDGRPVEELIAEYSKIVPFANERGIRRLAARTIVFRPQEIVPTAPTVGDTSAAVFRKADGSLKTYTLKWAKRGIPLENLSTLNSPFWTSKAPVAREARDPLAAIRQFQNWSWDEDRMARTQRYWTNENGEMESHDYVRGLGSRFPLFAPPAGFQVRVGPAAGSFFFSGTYQAEGKRIGYIRIPNFFPPNRLAAYRQFAGEIAFFKANTDGLVVDVMRNTGGGCIGLDYAKLLIPETFWFFGQQYLANHDTLFGLQLALFQAQNMRAEKWVIDTYQFYIQTLQEALRNGRSMTGPIPACTAEFSGPPAAPLFLNEPARSPAGDNLAYDKPVIFLVDDFSLSFGDIFPAMMQDNRRGPVVGMRTAGLGGATGCCLIGGFSESYTSNTFTMVTRRNPIVTTDFPTAPYIENIGVRPDIELDFMTRENLLQQGAPFVEGFTRILLEEIAKQR